MDDALNPKNDRRSLDREQKLRIIAAYELAGFSMADCERDHGWTPKSGADLRRHNSEQYRQVMNQLVDAAFDHVQRNRLRIVERLRISADNALAVLSCAVRGEPWNGRAVTGDQVRASKALLRQYMALTEHDAERTPAAEPEWNRSEEEIRHEELMLSVAFPQE